MTKTENTAAISVMTADMGLIAAMQIIRKIRMTTTDTADMTAHTAAMTARAAAYMLP